MILNRNFILEIVVYNIENTTDPERVTRIDQFVSTPIETSK